MTSDDLSVKIVCGIYGLKCKTTGKWYVGQSLNIFDRWEKAYKYKNCKGQRKIYRALLKYGYDDFDKIILEECNPIDWILDYREMYWMREYDSIKTGYNIREGGSHGKFSDETKMKMSAAKAGKPGHPWTDEMRHKIRVAREARSSEIGANISAAKKGRKLGPMSEAHRSKIAESHKNISAEWRAKISAALTGKKRAPFSAQHKLNLGASIKQGWARRNVLLQLDNKPFLDQSIQSLADTQLINSK
jgi:group I intron endonuclease